MVEFFPFLAPGFPHSDGPLTGAPVIRMQPCVKRMRRGPRGPGSPIVCVIGVPPHSPRLLADLHARCPFGGIAPSDPIGSIDGEYVNPSRDCSRRVPFVVLVPPILFSGRPIHHCAKIDS